MWYIILCNYLFVNIGLCEYYFVYLKHICILFFFFSGWSEIDSMDDKEQNEDTAERYSSTT